MTVKVKAYFCFWVQMFPVLTVNSVRTDWLCEVGVFRQSGVRACVPACVCVCVVR